MAIAVRQVNLEVRLRNCIDICTTCIGAFLQQWNSDPTSFV
eukprot:COSAG02_NODE_57959_length_279_cov_0.566667_1_plen_40_part_01